MANIRKSFNFRTGLQVDNDNFVVNANGLVGIGTSIPQNYLLNVHGDTRVTGLTTSGTLYAGIGTVGVLSATTADVSGILTVGQLKVGTSNVVNNLIGYGYTAWITDNGGTGLHTTSKIGVNTTTSPGASDVEFKVHGNANVTGILTAATLSGSVAATNLTGTIDNARLPSSISVSSVTATTFTGTATTASSLTGTPNITVGIVTATKLIANSIDVPSTGITTVSKLLHVGTGGTAFSALEAGRIGVGTALPTSELQIRKSSGSLAEVVSDSGQARISIGNSVGVGNSSAVLRFGNSAGVLDFINNDVGDIKTIIHGGTGAGSTGNFKWVYGQTNAERMTLTYDGNLGINDTTPSQRLSVGGGVTVTGNVHIDSDLTVDGNITGTISYPSVITGTNLNNTGGITTLSQLKVTESIDFDSIPTIGIQTYVGIGTTIPFSYDGSPVGLTVKNTLNANTVVVDDLLTMPSGIVTAATVSANFNSSDSTDSAVSITVLTSPDRIVFQVVGTALTATLNLS
jgi:hypothetical protein